MLYAHGYCKLVKLFSLTHWGPMKFDFSKLHSLWNNNLIKNISNLTKYPLSYLILSLKFSCGDKLTLAQLMHWRWLHAIVLAALVMTLDTSSSSSSYPCLVYTGASASSLRWLLGASVLMGVLPVDRVCTRGLFPTADCHASLSWAVTSVSLHAFMSSLTHL